MQCECTQLYLSFFFNTHYTLHTVSSDRRSVHLLCNKKVVSKIKSEPYNCNYKREVNKYTQNVQLTKGNGATLNIYTIFYVPQIKLKNSKYINL